MSNTTHRRAKFVPEMEGASARWYAKQRGSAPQLAAYRKRAAELTTDLPAGADVLEIAPGPGYLSVEIARAGRFRVTALDVSRTMVQIATENARRQSVDVDFRHGDAADLPFADESFDLVVCQAAFKNFTEPERALDEMYRVLRPGGTAVIEDLRKDSTAADIRQEVTAMELSRPSAALTRLALTGLRRRAYTRHDVDQLCAKSRFEDAAVVAKGIGMEVRLTKAPA